MDTYAFCPCSFIVRQDHGLRLTWLSWLNIKAHSAVMRDSVHLSTVCIIPPALQFSSRGSFITVSQPLSEVLIPGPPGDVRAVRVSAVVDTPTCRILTANNDRIRSPLLRGFAALHRDIIWGSVAVYSAVISLLKLVPTHTNLPPDWSIWPK